jgi:hypothetical protein
MKVGSGQTAVGSDEERAGAGEPWRSLIVDFDPFVAEPSDEEVAALIAVLLTNPESCGTIPETAAQKPSRWTMTGRREGTRPWEPGTA